MRPPPTPLALQAKNLKNFIYEYCNRYKKYFTGLDGAKTQPFLSQNVQVAYIEKKF